MTKALEALIPGKQKSFGRLASEGVLCAHFVIK